jgi:Na+/H+ antiporter
VEHIELILFGLLVVVAALVALAGVLRVPYPILLVIGGIGLGFIPGVPHVELQPDLVLLIFLPPLLYSAAVFTSLRDLRANLRPIGFLSIGLVLATVGTVAVVGHELVGLSWPVAFVLGAIVSPTDPVAATAIAGRLGVPRRVVTIIEGESLVNDATALVAYRFAVAAVVTGSFSVAEAASQFVVGVVGGVAVGLVVGRLVYEVRRRLDDPPVEVTISLLTGYAAYLPAEELGLSGVLAAVVAGIYVGWHTPVLTTPTVRLLGTGLWEMLVFLLNSVLFVLIGLQLPGILDGLAGGRPGELLSAAALVCAAVIGTRMVWVMVFAQVLPRLRARLVLNEAPPLRNSIGVGWMGMRGAVSLAAALAIPTVTASQQPFPERDLVIFLAFSVIFVTLVLQGLTLPALFRALRICDEGREAEAEEVQARLEAARAAIDRLEELVDEEWVAEHTAERMRSLYDYRQRRFSARMDGSDQAPAYDEHSAAVARLQRELLAAERAALLDLRNANAISDDVRRRVERELDLEESRLGG